MQINTGEQLTAEELLNLTSSQLLHKMEELRHLAVKFGGEWVEKQHLYRGFKEMMPSFLAVIQSEIMNKQHIKKDEAKVIALADNGYREKITLMNNAEKEMELADIKYRGVMKSIECLTSISYVRNSEMKLSR